MADIEILVTHQMTEPIMIAFFRPSISDRNPESKAAIHEPPAMDAVIPPWTSDRGPLQSAIVAGVGPWLK